MTKVERIAKMRRKLLAWFRANGRDLPWRRTSDPYHILVSEIMLQQTQVDRVIPKYHAFLKTFPSWRRLAAAEQADVVRMWDGLGYNRRAVALHKVAKQLCSPSNSPSERGRAITMQSQLDSPPPRGGARGGAQLPSAFDELIQLPGIGPYTAEAVRAFAFRAKGAAPVDTNIERILKRVFRAHAIDRKQLQKLASKVVPSDSWSWGHAMMDLGATVCTARAPKCESCPLKLICAAYPCEGGDVVKRPQKKFADSDRMYRGRMIASLRGKAFDADDLRIAIELGDEERYGRLVDGLMKEGLIRLKDGKLELV